MGNRVDSNCSAEISLTRPDRIFFLGEPITGNVRICSERAMRVNGIYLSLVTKASYNKLVDDTNMRLQRTLQYHSRIHEQKTCLRQHEELPEGESILKFSIDACETLPPSVHHSKYTNISHRLQLLADLPMHISTCRLLTCDITIVPRVSAMNAMLWLTKTSMLGQYVDCEKPMDNAAECKYEKAGHHSLKGTRCTLCLPTSHFSVRQVIPYTVEVGCSPHLEGLKLTIRFVQYVIMYNNLYKKTLNLRSMEMKSERFGGPNNSNNNNGAKENGYFMLSKTTTAPSYSCQSYSIEVSYMLICEVRALDERDGPDSITIAVPVFIDNDEVVSAHPSKSE